MNGYDYRCPCCKERNISFLNLDGERITFRCNFCEVAFTVKDQEPGYSPNKEAALKERYPLQVETS